MPIEIVWDPFGSKFKGNCFSESGCGKSREEIGGIKNVFLSRGGKLTSSSTKQLAHLFPVIV